MQSASQKLAELIAAAVEVASSDNAVDIGCGHRPSALKSASAKRLEGSDISEHAFATAEEKDRHHLGWLILSPADAFGTVAPARRTTAPAWSLPPDVDSVSLAA